MKNSLNSVDCVDCVTRARLILKMMLALMLFFAGGVGAAVVAPGIGYTNAFEAQPEATDWATLSIAGAGADEYDQGDDVNASITAAGVTTGTLIGRRQPSAAECKRDVEFLRVLPADSTDRQPVYGADGQIREQHRDQCHGNYALVSSYNYHREQP